MITNDTQPLSLPESTAPGRWSRGAQVMRWLAPESFEWALSFLYFTALITFIGGNLPAVTGGAFPWRAALVVAAATLGLFGLDRWEHWRYGSLPPRAAAAALLIARMVLIEVVGLVDPSDAFSFLYLIVPFIAAITLGSRVGWLVGGLLWARMNMLMFSEPSMYLPTQMVQSLVLMPVGIVFVLALARLIVAERNARLRTEQLVAELEESNAQLTAYAAQVAALTLTDERNRLARDIHDSLGHYLTTINVQLRTASAFRERDPAQAAQAIEEAKRLSHTALDDVRRSVGMLRAGAPTFVFEQALHDLVAPLRSERLVIDLTITGSAASYAPATLMALYRVAQEGLTNVQRHAQASRAQLAVRLGEEEATVTLRDDGTGFDPALLADSPLLRAGSYGLQGIRERLLLVGGAVQITSAPGQGTTLTLTAPKTGPAQRRHAPDGVTTGAKRGGG